MRSGLSPPDFKPKNQVNKSTRRNASRDLLFSNKIAYTIRRGGGGERTEKQKSKGDSALRMDTHASSSQENETKTGDPMPLTTSIPKISTSQEHISRFRGKGREMLTGGPGRGIRPSSSPTSCAHPDPTEPTRIRTHHQQQRISKRGRKRICKRNLFWRWIRRGAAKRRGRREMVRSSPPSPVPSPSTLSLPPLSRLN